MAHGERRRLHWPPPRLGVVEPRVRPPDPLRGGRKSNLLTAEEVAERWQVPRSHVYGLARAGRLPTVELGRYRRWTLEAVEAFERGGGTAERKAAAA